MGDKARDREKRIRSGEAGPAAAFALDILDAFSAAIGAEAYLEITGSHIDGCLYHGEVSLDFVERLVALGGRVAVPTTLNVGSMDLIHPEIMRQPEAEKGPHTRLMIAHEELGCVPTFTCAPYQTIFRPRFGEQIAWGESNAIVFANSVIGARTARYGDFIDLCCAMTGLAPAHGLHLDDNRAGDLLIELAGPGLDDPDDDTLFVGAGLVAGLLSGEGIPVISGLPKPRDEDQLKALGAAAATTGAVALFHAVGITPEAPTLDAAFRGRPPKSRHVVGRAEIDAALARLSQVPPGTALAAVCLGTPHFSRAEWLRLADLLEGSPPGKRLPIHVNTGRDVLSGLEADGILDRLKAHDVRPVVDTCTYLTAAILGVPDGAVMTNSGKWAHYAPGNVGVRVAFGGLADCVASARTGRVERMAR